jgi:tetratricopeptide (TPR) repeat protein
VNYYIHNNLGYCLNQRGEYERARHHCETAIQLDPSRANAIKNLGASLAGLGKYIEAAQTWLRAIHVDASDKRAWELLDALVKERREIILEAIPDIDQQMEACRKAIATAQGGRFADWAKGLILN